MGYNRIKDGAGKEQTLNRIEELFDFLSEGKTPEGMFIKYPPKLGARKAMTIIWFLQEHMDIISDRFEMCVTCKTICDADQEGSYDEKTDRFYCDVCER